MKRSTESAKIKKSEQIIRNAANFEDGGFRRWFLSSSRYSASSGTIGRDYDDDFNIFDSMKSRAESAKM